MVSHSMLAFVGSQWASTFMPSLVQEQDSSSSLTNWLQKNKAHLPSKIGQDENGLRGLMNRSKEACICRIPRHCIITADPASLENNQRPIDALAETLLNEIRLEEESHYFPYLEHLPSASDLSLACIGGTWSDEQLDFLGYDSTIEYFKRLRSQREDFVLKNGGGSKILAGWAYDLASSRALEGPFGKGGRVRASVAGTMFAFSMALLTPFLYTDISSATIWFVSTLPIVPSMASLVSSLTSNEELAMLPWIDIANHRSKSRLYLKYSLLRDDVQLKRDKEPFVNNVNGEDFSYSFAEFDYGGTRVGVSNDKLLGEYGFVEIDNPNDTIDIFVNGSSIKLGRNGVICSPMRDSSVEELKRAARRIRSKLETADKSRHRAVVGYSDVDLQLRLLAAKWRKEKIRLLDEFVD